MAIIGSGEGDLRESKILDLFKKVSASTLFPLVFLVFFVTLSFHLLNFFYPPFSSREVVVSNVCLNSFSIDCVHQYTILSET